MWKDWKPILTTFIPIAALWLLLNCSCEKSTTGPPPPPEPQILLSLAEEPSLTEISLKLETRNLALPQQFLITRDDSAIFNHLIDANDTTVTDTGLFPATTYSYRAYRLVNGQRADSSAVLQASTMDTTSHEFSWEMFTFGDAASILRDVFIIEENDIWAVGKISISDSSGPPFGAVHWNGEQWQLKRLPTQAPNYTTYLIPQGVFAFSSTEIWFASGGVHLYNGQTIHSYWINDFPGNPNPILEPGQSIEKLWGTSGSNLYGVGNQGAIAHFDGSNWQKMESHTDVDLLDVWGSPDTGGTGGSVVWACGWEDFKPTVLLRYEDGIWKKVYEDQDNISQVYNDTLSGILASGWMFNDRELHLASTAGLYILSADLGKIERSSFTSSFFPGFPWRMRGNNVNDLMLAGEFFMMVHYNGSTWRHYQNLSGYGRLYSVAQEGDLICAAGVTFDFFSKAVVLLGNR